MLAVNIHISTKLSYDKIVKILSAIKKSLQLMIITLHGFWLPINVVIGNSSKSDCLEVWVYLQSDLIYQFSWFSELESSVLI